MDDQYVLEEIKQKYKMSNKYMLCVTYEDIGILIRIIEVLENDIETLIAENKELKEENEGLKTKLDTLIEKYKELKEMLKHRIEYTNKLEEDLFQNDSNYVIPKSKVKELLKEIQEEGKIAYKNFMNKKLEEDFEKDGAILQELGYIEGRLQSLLGKE